jgi:hypothetical protein
MATIKVPMNKFAEQARRLAADFIPTVKRGMVSGAARCVVIMQEATRTAKVFDTGYYLRAWQSAPTDTGARIFNVSPYAGIIELGRRAGARMPPVQVIAKWLQRARGLSRKEAEAAAFGVARSIAKRGIAGKLVMNNALPRLIAAVEDEILRELEAKLAHP